MPESFENLDGPSRRMFVAHAARVCLGVGAAPLLFPSTATAAQRSPKKLIYLFMSGGMSHIDTFDPKPGAEIQGPTEPISTSVAGVRLGQHLPKLATRMNQFSLIRSMSSTQGAHAPGRYLARTSYAPRATVRHPSLNSWVNNLSGNVNKNIPGGVVINGGSDHPGAGFMDLKFAPLPIGNPEAGLKNSKLLGGVNDKDFRRRLNHVAKFGERFFKRYPFKKVKGYGEMYAEAVRLMRSEDVKTFDLKQEKADVRDKYGRNSFGQGCLLARRLIQRDVRVVEVELGGWDTHNENFTELAEKVPVLDQAVSALLDELKENGLLSSTMVVLTSEFGRSPRINPRSGRDHHPAAYTSLIAGGSVKPGQIYGKSDDEGHYVEEDEVTVADFNATIAHGLNLPVERVVTSPSGRPFKVANEGQPVTGLFG